MRTNAPSFGKRTPLTRAHFAEFEKAFGGDPLGKSKRKDQGETGRFNEPLTRKLVRAIRFLQPTVRDGAVLSIAQFFAGREYSQLTVEPVFSGCGWLSESRGDVVVDQTLIEIKAGERGFRSIDLHQLLTYCALNFAKKSFDIARVGLLNPRGGTFMIVDVDELCEECAGSPAADVLDEILEYLSEPMGTYRG